MLLLEIHALDAIAARCAALAPRWGSDPSRELACLRASARQFVRAGDRAAARAQLARCSALLPRCWTESILDCYGPRPARQREAVLSLPDEF
jgi:hypothetical protein